LQATRVVVAALATGGALVFAGPGASAPTWGAPAQVAPGHPGGYAFYPAVAMNGAGDALVGWQWGSGAVSLTQVASRARRAHGWSRPVDLAAGGSEPSLAIDQAGDALAGFAKGNFIGGVFQVAYRRGPEGPWQDPITVSPAPNTMGGRVAVNDAGDAVAGFTRWPGTGYVTQAAIRPASSGRWQQVVDLSDPAGNSPVGAAVAIDRAGNALALWVHAGSSADNPVIASTFRPAGGSWTAPVDLGGPYGSVADMHVAFDAAGNAVAVWKGFVRSSGGDVVFASYRPFGGAWTNAISLSPPNKLTIEDLSLTVDAAGNALALWSEVTQGRQAVVTADSRPAATGKWEPLEQLSLRASSPPRRHWRAIAPGMPSRSGRKASPTRPCTRRFGPAPRQAGSRLCRSPRAPRGPTSRSRWTSTGTRSSPGSASPGRAAT
jgi:hypothetical protein